MCRRYSDEDVDDYADRAHEEAVQRAIDDEVEAREENARRDAEAMAAKRRASGHSVELLKLEGARQ